MARSTTHGYTVDWSDAAFPTIRPAGDIWPGEAQTLSACKREIISHFQGHIDHAREQIAQARTLRRDDVLREAAEANDF